MDCAMMRGAGFARARRGQSTVEFAFIAIVVVGLLLAVIDLGRAGFVQHSLDRGAADLAQSLAGISGTTTSGSPYVYTPPPLNPITSTVPQTYTVYQGISMTVPLAMQKALDHARTVAGGAFSNAALVPPAGSFGSNTTTITNTQVTVVGTPSLTAPTEITVTVTAPFTPVVGLFLGNRTFRLRSTEAAIPVAGQTSS
jgi:Flp pilus assembly protein TadG